LANFDIRDLDAYLCNQIIEILLPKKKETKPGLDELADMEMPTKESMEKTMKKVEEIRKREKHA
jgi:hypothetical protein